MKYFLLAVLVLAINLMPIFAPPTWAILVFYKLNSTMNTFALIAIGVIAASTGRYFLARATGLLRKKLKPRYIENLSTAKNFLAGKKRGLFFYLVFFIISPLPSAQVFEAAALMDAPLIPITAAFMLGRGISYSTTVLGATSLKAHAMGPLILESLKSPWGIGIQALCLLSIYLLMKVEWSKLLN